MSIETHDRGTARIADLLPAPYNPRKISKEAMKGLSSSLQRFGIVQEIVVNRTTGHIVGGHQRVQALQDQGVTEVPVVWVDLSEAEEKALNVALNSQMISGEFDDNVLADLLADVSIELPDVMKDLRLDELMDTAMQIPPEPKEKPAKSVTCPECGHCFQAGG